MLDTLERFYIYREAQNKNQIMTYLWYKLIRSLWLYFSIPLTESHTYVTRTHSGTNTTVNHASSKPKESTNRTATSKGTTKQKQLRHTFNRKRHPVNNNQKSFQMPQLSVISLQKAAHKRISSTHVSPYQYVLLTD